MPISDAYIIQYLVDGTRQVPETICWREKSAEQTGYTVLVEGIEVILESEYSRAGAHLTLRFRHDDEFRISEPAAGGWLGRKCAMEDERHVVKLFRDDGRGKPRSASNGEWPVTQFAAIWKAPRRPANQSRRAVWRSSKWTRSSLR